MYKHLFYQSTLIFIQLLYDYKLIQYWFQP